MEIDKDKNLRDKQKDHFNSIADNYINIRKTNQGHLEFKKILWEYFFSKNALDLEKADILEPMCGYAEGYDIIKNFSNIIINNYSGFDYSENIVNYCNNNRKNLNIYFLDIINFNESNKFDLAIIIGGFHHVYRDADLAIKNVSNSIKSNGYIINFEPTNEMKIIKNVRAKIYKYNNFFDEKSEKDFNLKQLNNIFQNHDLDLINNYRVGYLAYIFFYNPDAFPIFSKIPKFLVRFLFNIDILISRIFFINKLSFATISIYKKNKN